MRRETFGAPSRFPPPQIWSSSWSPPFGGELSSPADPAGRESGPRRARRSEARAPGAAVSTSPESLNHSLPTEDSLLSKGNMEETYEMNALPCWDHYKSHMDSIKDWCNWTLISRHYSDLQNCLEYHADRFGLGFPNPLAERIFFETHLIHFTNCSLVQPTFSDPPEDVLLAMIIAPICLIPFLVTLVVWRSKDSDAQA
ncbi:receptor activity-modifying protein 2 isoform X1 [Cricetulus griseus]|uniref:receptor activity-modifying protein 2 isoform X1 n=1 Tax=Cricetulus griseus TaxID=10029 RepID=UPI00022F4F00|nr:receptor activity-modifying protein 2 isoform X1 [Cricetulus griseus]